MPPADIATSILGMTAEQNLVCGLLVLIIIGLIWDRNRLLKDLREISTDFRKALESNAKEYAAAQDRNTQAFMTLGMKIDALKNH